uniref:Coiled-coil domain-containing protein 80 n=1 Tax=Latimeria chalumnae TaxID=7897 RepID=H3BAR3_LATCH
MKGTLALSAALLLALWAVCGFSEDPSAGGGWKRSRAAKRALAAARLFTTAGSSPRRSGAGTLSGRNGQPRMLQDEGGISQVRSRTSRARATSGRRVAQVRRPQQPMAQDESTASSPSRSSMARGPTGSGNPNILVSFAGKNRLLVISAPHASDGYYRLMMSILKNDVYCELAERHIQQIILFHEEGELGGKVRRITNEGKILEEPLDPSIVPKLMNFLKLEKGKFGMVLLKKTLQVEERYPYPVRLEAMYEVIDQSPIRKIEKIRQKGFVQKCKTAGVEGQVSGTADGGKRDEDKERPRPPPRRETVQVSARKPIRTTVSSTTTAKTTTRGTKLPPTTTTTTPTTTTTVPTTTTTKATTTTTRPPTTTTPLPSTQRPWTTRSHTTWHSTPNFNKPSMVAEVAPKSTATAAYYPSRYDNRRDRQQGNAERNVAPTSKPGKTTSYLFFDSFVDTTTGSTATSESYTKSNIGRYPNSHSDKKYYGRKDSSVTTGQHKLTKIKPPKKKATGQVLSNEYEGKYDVDRPITTNMEEELDMENIPQKKVKDQKNNEKKKKGKTSKKERGGKKSKPEKDRSNKKKKPAKNKDDFQKSPKKSPVHETRKSLATFLDYFENKRRLLLITAPYEEDDMYVQQRDEYLESVCEMAVRKITIITIFGTMSNNTMKIDHYQLESERPMKVIREDDLLDQELIIELRKDYGMTYNDFFMVLTDFDMKVKQYYEVPIAMKAIFEFIDTFPSRIKEMEKQKREGISCKKEDKPRSLENFLSRFRWRRRLFVISTPSDEEWAYQQQLHALSSQACNLGLRHVAILKLVGVGIDADGVLELYPINGSTSVEREDLSLSLVKDIRNYFQVSPEYFSMLFVGKDGNVKSWYPSPMWSMAIVYDLVDSMQLRRQEMAIQQSLGMRCPEDEYGGYGYHGYHQGYQDEYYHHSYHHEHPY